MRAQIVWGFVITLAAGCGSDVPEDGPSRPTRPPDALLVEVERPRTLPVAIYADGRVLTPAPHIAIYPAPALPAFNVARIPPEQARIIADRLGQLGEADAAATDAILADLPVSSADALYEPTALAVVTAAPAEPEPGIEPEERDWPLGDLPPGCSVIRGADLEPVLAAAARANQLTRWRIAGGLTVGVTFRPLLPHERSCDDVAGL